MKYSLYKELLDPNNILSHVFLNISDEMCIEIAKKNEGLNVEQIEAREVDIKLIIDGKSYNPQKFFDNLFNQYKYYVEKEAANLVKASTTDKFKELVDKLNEFAEITEYWANDITWSTEENKFIKL